MRSHSCLRPPPPQLCTVWTHLRQGLLVSQLLRPDFPARVSYSGRLLLPSTPRLQASTDRRAARKHSLLRLRGAGLFQNEGQLNSQLGKREKSEVVS